MPDPLPPTQPQDPHPTEPLLEAGLAQRKQIGDDTNSLLETIVHQNEKNNPEPILEAQLVQSKQSTEKILEALKPAGDAGNFIANFLAAIKGDTGDKGDRGDRGEKGEQGQSIKGDKGDSIRGEQGIQGVAGRDGKDGADGTDGKDGRDGKDGKSIRGEKGEPGKDGAPDSATAKLFAELKRQFKNLSSSVQHSNMITFRADGVLIANGAVVNFKTGPGVILVPVQTKDGMDITISATATGGGTPETPPETANAVTTVFTVSARPKWVVTESATYFEGAGYSYAALQVTMDVAPSQYIRVIT